MCTTSYVGIEPLSKTGSASQPDQSIPADVQRGWRRTPLSSSQFALLHTVADRSCLSHVEINHSWTRLPVLGVSNLSGPRYAADVLCRLSHRSPKRIGVHEVHTNINTNIAPLNGAIHTLPEKRAGVSGAAGYHTAGRGLYCLLSL